METVLIPNKRISAFEKVLDKASKKLNCTIELLDNERVRIDGTPYDEYNAKNVILAFGMGFSMVEAYKLLDDNYYFKFINIKDLLKNDSEMKRIKARIIGEDGKTKAYIEEVSGVVLSLYENTLGIIGTTEQLAIATAALQVLVEGGTHKKAYRIMESLRKKYRMMI